MHALTTLALLAGSATAIFPKIVNNKVVPDWSSAGRPSQKNTQDAIGFGATWWLNSNGQPGGDLFIVSTNTTLQVPEAPSPQVDRLALWPGMETAQQGLVQSIIVSFANPANDAPAGCDGQAGQWCAFASLYTPSGGQSSGNYVPVNAGDMLDIDYIYDDSTGVTTQYVSLSGQLISTFQSNTGRPYYYDSQVECQADANGNTPAHTYFNTQIVLNQADPDFGSTLVETGSDDSGLSTPDGGLTWIVDQINMESYDCTPAN